MPTIKFGWLLTIIVICCLTIIYQYQIAKLREELAEFESSQIRMRLDNKHVANEENIILVYNRVPKTGSTSFMGVAYDLCKANNFHVLHVNVTANSHVLTLRNQFALVRNITQWNSMKPAIYHGHFAFIDFSKFGAPKPLYINILRKPLERFVSYYYFLRYGDNYRPHLKRRRQGDTMTFDECMAKSSSDCDITHMWLQIPFFCGHAEACWRPANRWALEQAKFNLASNYFAVGVTDELADFVSMLEQTIPRLFGGATAHFSVSNNSHLRQTIQKTWPSADTVRHIKRHPVWQMENEFYEFALNQWRFLHRQNYGQKVLYEKIRPKTPYNSVALQYELLLLNDVQ